jgi:RNA polymerase sigma-70 factor (ECF subfamily)
MLREAMNELDPNIRAALRLRFHEGLSFKEVAQALEIPLGTAVSRIQRGVQLLRARFARRGQGPRACRTPA